MIYISEAAVWPCSHLLSPLSEIYNWKIQCRGTRPPNQDTLGDKEFVCSLGSSRIKGDIMNGDAKELPKRGKIWIREWQDSGEGWKFNIGSWRFSCGSLKGASRRLMVQSAFILSGGKLRAPKFIFPDTEWTKLLNSLLKLLFKSMKALTVKGLPGHAGAASSAASGISTRGLPFKMVGRLLQNTPLPNCWLQWAIGEKPRLHLFWYTSAYCQ